MGWAALRRSGGWLPTATCVASQPSAAVDVLASLSCLTPCRGFYKQRWRGRPGDSALRLRTPGSTRAAAGSPPPGSRGQPCDAVLRRPQGRARGASQWPRRRAPGAMDCGVRRRRAPSRYGSRCAALAVLLLVVVLQHAEPAFRCGSRPITGPARHAGSSAAQPPEPSVVALPSETPGGWRKRHEPSRGLPRRKRWR